MSEQLLLHLTTMSGQPHWLSKPGPSETALLCVAGGDSFQLPLPLLAAVSPLLQKLLRDNCHLHQPVVMLPMVTKNTLLTLTSILDKGEVVVQSKSKRMKRKLGEVMDMLGIVGDIRDLDDMEKETASAINLEKENGENFNNHVDEDVKGDNVGPDESVKNGYVSSTNFYYVNIKEKVLDENYPEENLVNSDLSPQFQAELKVSFQVASPIVKDLCRKINNTKKVSSPAYDEETEYKEKEKKINKADTDSDDQKDNKSAQDLIGVDSQEGEVQYQFEPPATPSGKCTGGRYPGYLTIKHTNMNNHFQTYCLNKVYHGSRDRVTLYYLCIKKKAGCRTKCKVLQVSQRGRLYLVQSSLKEEHNHAVLQQVAVN